MNVDLLQSLPSSHVSRPAGPHIGLISCSVCLRVLRGSGWVDAEDVISEIRSYELDTPPRLQAALCEGCVAAIADRRAEAEPLAA